jgi:hypothetical protein
MHAREIIVILFIILLILFGLRTYGYASVGMPTHAIKEPLTVYPKDITSNDSLGIDPVTQRNTYANKYVSPPATENIKPARTRKNVSFATQKEVASYSRLDGEIKDIVNARV